MLLSGYFDESERGEASEPICVAGWLFKPDGYKKFTRKWYRDVLLDGQLKHFHMTDLCAGHGEYRGMDIAARQAILSGAVDAIRKHSYAGISAQFDRAEFAAVAPPEWAEYRGSIYTGACAICVQSTAYWLHRWNCPGDVVFVFERGHKFQGQAQSVFNSILKNESARKDFRVRNCVFEDKNEHGLQAADLFAWMITKMNVITAGHPPAALRPFIESLLRLASPGHDRFKVHVFTGDKLRRFMIEQAEGEEWIPVDFGPGKKALR